MLETVLAGAIVAVLAKVVEAAIAVLARKDILRRWPRRPQPVDRRAALVGGTPRATATLTVATFDPRLPRAYLHD